MSADKVRNSWRGMRERCENPNHQAYLHYGGRGIRVCERWRSFGNFLSDMGRKPVSMTLDRIDNMCHYEPGNCQWASRRTQSNNTRRNVFMEVDGERKTLAQWARTKGIPYSKLQTRLKLGWPIERSLGAA